MADLEDLLLRTDQWLASDTAKYETDCIPFRLVRDLRVAVQLVTKFHDAGMPTDPDTGVQWIGRLIKKCERCDQLQTKLEAILKGQP